MECQRCARDGVVNVQPLIQLGQQLSCGHGLAFPDKNAPDPPAGLKGQIDLGSLDSSRIIKLTLP